MHWLLFSQDLATFARSKARKAASAFSVSRWASFMTRLHYLLWLNDQQAQWGVYYIPWCVKMAFNACGRDLHQQQKLCGRNNAHIYSWLNINNCFINSGSHIYRASSIHFKLLKQTVSNTDWHQVTSIELHHASMVVWHSVHKGTPLKRVLLC